MLSIEDLGPIEVDLAGLEALLARVEDAAEDLDIPIDSEDLRAALTDIAVLALTIAKRIRLAEGKEL